MNDPGRNTAPQAASREPVLLRVDSDPTISLSVQFGAGAQNDPPGKEGLAYLTGRLLEEGGTERNRYEQILEQLYPLATDYGCRIDRETTTFAGRVHRDNLARYLELYTDAWLRPAFSKDDFERVRNDAINDLENTLRYASDEELGKATLQQFVFEGTPYAHPVEGTVQGLKAITLDDVRGFYRRHCTAGNALLAIGGGFDEALVAELEAARARLPAGGREPPPAIEPAPFEGRRLRLVAKPGADASISFGFPLHVRRGETDFYALWIANSWLGEHRSQVGRLFNVIRELRGLNYGDYSYIEAFPEGAGRSMPPVNCGRRRQLFEVWIRTLPNAHAPFALRAALDELTRLVDEGLGEAEFERTRAFLAKYRLHFAATTETRLGYALDDRFYGLDEEGHLERFARMMETLTLDDVNAAIRRHLQHRNLKIAIVTGEPDTLRQALASGAPTPVSYASPMPAEVLAEDKRIAALPLDIAAENIGELGVGQAFETGTRNG